MWFFICTFLILLVISNIIFPPKPPKRPTHDKEGNLILYSDEDLD